MKPAAMLLACLVVAAVAAADEPGPHVRQALPNAGLLGKPPCPPWPLYHGCCPDDYCPKALPCVSKQHWCGPDDYCCKPLPPCPPRAPLGCDDYCGKKCNILLGVPCSPFNTCGKPDGCCKDRCRPWHFWFSE